MSTTILTILLLCLIGPFCLMCSHSHGSSATLPTGPCEYRQIQGRAVITAVRNAAEGAYNCKQAVEIIFAFIPDDPSANKTYRFPQQSDSGRPFTVGAGLNPPCGWAQRVGLVQGAIHRCVRQEIIKGACTPVLFTFPELDLTGWEQECFNKGAPKDGQRRKP
jgi:hypothetical protein